ncbi:MAG: glycerate kinase [Anaerovibrio sp.]|uniref:glycerate kinase family protein n=1 Tax=Anaerovibrio sp. TaxID=1872532 RepID=UPI0025D30184|nr:glycerate kinase [Anaerovibrio sp.]MCR5176670.1 glycerate kinase [Anaerovibrio sp.]
MNTVIAIDSFKGSLSSFEAGNIAKRSLKKIFPEGEIHVFPLADGGEGTVDTLVEGLGGKIIHTTATGPLGSATSTRFGHIPEKNTAIIEMADIAGLTMVPDDLRNPLNTTTYGLGELIIKALDMNIKNLIIGIGGSSTNDAGLGMLTALGCKFLKEDGSPVGITGKALKDIKVIDTSMLDKRLAYCNVQVACDVNNPLYGPNGCSHIYAPQKGADKDTVLMMDAFIKNFADLAEKKYNIQGANMPGAGAAGGLGYAFYGFLHAELKPGIQLILDALNISGALDTANLLITGEGRIDQQTAMGKGPCGVAQLAKKINPEILTIAVCGCASPEAEAVNDAGIDAYFPILHMPSSVNEAMKKETSAINLAQTITQIGRILGHMHIK